MSELEECRERLQKLLNPLPQDSDPAKRLARLTEALAEVDRCYELMIGEKPSYDGRGSSLDALTAIKNFLDSADIAWSRTLWRLVEALRDADRGKQNPLTRPSKVKGRPQPTNREYAGRAISAAALQVRLDHGQTKAVAAAAVAADIAGISKGFEPTPRTIMSWRDNFANGTDVGARYYRFALSTLRSVAFAGLSEHVRAWLYRVLRKVP